MRNIEEKLRKIPLVDVPDRLNRRVDETLCNKKSWERRIIWRPVPLWISAIACLVCFGAGLWFARSEVKPETTVCRTTTWIVNEKMGFNNTFAKTNEPSEFFLRKKNLVNEPKH